MKSIAVRLVLVSLGLALLAPSTGAQVEPALVGDDPIVCPDGRECGAGQLCARVPGTPGYACINGDSCPADRLCDPECCPLGSECVSGHCPLPDLTVSASRLRPTIRTQTFGAQRCELRADEGPCVFASGPRRLLAFTTFTPNLGEGALFLGRPVDRPELFVFSECHGHYHFESYAKYELLDQAGNVVVDGGKRAFCLIDFTRVDPSAGPARFDCDDQGLVAQGISRGWADEYFDGLPCQWIDITDVPAGTYTLQVRVNFAEVVAETSFANNVTRVPVTIPLLVCQISLSPTSLAFPSQPGGGSVRVIANDQVCAWAAASNVPWITITSGSAGRGTADVTYSVEANPDALSRTGTLTIGGQTFTLTQAGVACSFQVAPTTASFPTGGGAGSVDVRAPGGCPWSAASDSDWIAVTSIVGGSGNGTVQYGVAANPNGFSRTGTLTVAGQPVTVTQEGAACGYAISPPGASVVASGGAGAVGVSAPAGCGWSATSNASWLTITGGGNGSNNGGGVSGSGPGSVTYSVAPNPGGARTGTLTVAGLTFAVTQAPATTCSYSITPTSASFGAGGGNGAVTVTSGSGCAWGATSQVPWIVVTAITNGVGGGSVGYSVSPNGGPARTGTLTVAGRTFTVSQAGACSFSLSPASASFDRYGGGGSFNVATGSGCTWAAASQAPWLRIEAGNGGPGGVGPGIVSYSVDANEQGVPRTGVITVGGQTLTVQQTP